MIPGSNPGRITSKNKTMNKIKERKKAGATCPVCKSPDYNYKGRAGVTQFSKHQFECNSCKHIWQYGSSNSIYTELQ